MHVAVSISPNHVYTDIGSAEAPAHTCLKFNRQSVNTAAFWQRSMEILSAVLPWVVSNVAMMGGTTCLVVDGGAPGAFGEDTCEGLPPALFSVVEAGGGGCNGPDWAPLG